MNTKCQSIDGWDRIPILMDFLNTANRENQERIINVVFNVQYTILVYVRSHFEYKCMSENRNSDSKTCSIMCNWKNVCFYEKLNETFVVIFHLILHHFQTDCMVFHSNYAMPIFLLL